MIPGLRVIELLLELALEAMKGQSVEQRQKIWDWYIADVSWWREKLHIGVRES